MTGPHRPLGPTYGPRPTDWPQAPDAPGTRAPRPPQPKRDLTYPLFFLGVFVLELLAIILILIGS